MPLSFSILFDVYGRLSEGLGLLQFVDGQIELLQYLKVVMDYGLWAM